MNILSTVDLVLFDVTVYWRSASGIKIPVFHSPPWESYANGNGHGVVRGREWELISVTRKWKRSGNINPLYLFRETSTPCYLVGLVYNYRSSLSENFTEDAKTF